MMQRSIQARVQVAILTLVRNFKGGKRPCAYYSNSSARFHCKLEGDLVVKLNPGPTNNDDQSTISTHCSRGRCAALSTRSAVLSIAANVNRLPFHNTSHGYLSTPQAHVGVIIIVPI